VNSAARVAASYFFLILVPFFAKFKQKCGFYNIIEVFTFLFRGVFLSSCP